MRFLIDAQLPPALARWLSARGHVAEHVLDLGMERAGDREIWDYACRVQAVLVTKDEDFVNLRALSADPVAVIWVRVGNTTRRALLALFERLMPDIERALQAGEKLIEIRS